MSLFSSLWNSAFLPQLMAKAIIIFLSFPIHECAHAWMAARLGDPTGENAGRITLNPIKHLDLGGTILLIAFGVGYAKPVPVNTRYFRNPKQDRAIVSMAGPMSNLIMAAIFLLVSHVIYKAKSDTLRYGTFIYMLVLCFRSAAYINIRLTIFNLVPIPPLDGYHMLMVLIPNRYYQNLSRMEGYSTYILLGALLLASFFRASPISAVAQGLYNSLDCLYAFLLQS